MHTLNAVRPFAIASKVTQHLFLTPFEWTIARRYILPGRSEAFIALVAGISLVAVMLGVAALVIVMSVMNGFRAELMDKIVGLNGHAVIQAYGGRLDDWQGIVKTLESTPGVTRATPLVEQPLLATFNGRVEAIIARGNTQADIARLADKKLAGSFKDGSPAPGRSRSDRGWPKIWARKSVIRSPSSIRQGVPPRSAQCRAKSAIAWRPSLKSASMIMTTRLW